MCGIANGLSRGGSWLFLGDSVTMGMGVTPDSTFAGRLAAVSDLRVLNPSLIGYDVLDYQIVLEHHLGAESTSVPAIRRATIFWCLNDLPPAGMITDAPGQPVRRLAGPLLGFLQRHARSYQWLKKQLTDRPRAYFEHDRRRYETAALDSAAARITAMNAAAIDNDIQFDVVLLPYEYQLRDGSLSAYEPQQALQRMLANAGIQTYDTAPLLRSASEDPSALYLYGDGIHFSSLGHRAIAQALTPFAGPE